MRTGLSFGEIVSAVALTALLASPQALGQMSAYSTDMEEPDIMTVKNEHCCLSPSQKQEANVEIDVKGAYLPSVKKIRIHVLDAQNQEVAQFSTRDRIIYMHLPEGKYTVRVDGAFDHRQVNVDASETVLTKYTS